MKRVIFTFWVILFVLASNAQQPARLQHDEQKDIKIKEEQAIETKAVEQKQEAAPSAPAKSCGHVHQHQQHHQHTEKHCSQHKSTTEQSAANTEAKPCCKKHAHECKHKHSQAACCKSKQQQNQPQQ